MSPQHHHVEQEHANWCVPACVAMVLKRRGTPLTQAQICAGWQGSRRGYSLGDAARFLGLAPPALWAVDSSAIHLIRRELARGQWIIIWVFNSVIAEVNARRVPRPTSKHGHWPEGFGQHSILLVGVTDAAILYLDPYFPETGQPFEMSDEELAMAFQGTAVF